MSKLTREQAIGLAPLPDPTTAPPPAPPAVGDIDAGKLPVINIKSIYSVIAGEVARAIPRGMLYKLNDKFVTIRTAPDGSAEVREMDPERFVTWLEENAICAFASPPRGEKPAQVTSLSPAQASLILRSDAFRQSLPEVEEIAPVRLPRCETVHRTGQPPLYKFTPVRTGYDAESKIYTLDSVPINWAAPFSLDVARAVFVRYFQESALDGGLLIVGPDGTTRQHGHEPLKSRSLGAAVAAVLGTFLHHCMTLFPIILVNANQPGTGKTFLTRMLLAPVHGMVDASNYSDDDEQFKNTLNSKLLSGCWYVFLDDLKNLQSQHLNRFTVNATISDRLFHTQSTFKAKNRMQFFANGNLLRCSPDVLRRSVSIDLFWSGDAKKREYTGPLNEDTILDTSRRQLVLSACWGLVKAWEAAGCPQPVPHGTLKTFDHFNDLAVNIAVWAGFENPLGPSMVNMDTGDPRAVAMMELLSYMADQIAPDYEEDPHQGLSSIYRPADLVEAARKLDMLDMVVNTGASLDGQCRSMGMRLADYNDREFVDHRGRQIRLTRPRNRKKGTLYEFVVLTEPTMTLEASASLLEDHRLVAEGISLAKNRRGEA